MSTVGTSGPPVRRTPAPVRPAPSWREAALENRQCSRRVRYEVRDGLAVAAFSAGASTALTLVITFALSRVG